MDKGGLVVIGCGWIAQRHDAAARRLRRPLIFASRAMAERRVVDLEPVGLAPVELARC